MLSNIDFSNIDSGQTFPQDWISLLNDDPLEQVSVSLPVTWEQGQVNGYAQDGLGISPITASHADTALLQTHNANSNQTHELAKVKQPVCEAQVNLQSQTVRS